MDHHAVSYINSHMARSRRIVCTLEKIKSPGFACEEGTCAQHPRSPSAVCRPTFHPFPQLLITQLTKPEQSKLVLGDAPPHTYG